MMNSQPKVVGHGSTVEIVIDGSENHKTWLRPGDLVRYSDTKSRLYYAERIMMCSAWRFWEESIRLRETIAAVKQRWPQAIVIAGIVYPDCSFGRKYAELAYCPVDAVVELGNDLDLQTARAALLPTVQWTDEPDMVLDGIPQVKVSKGD